MSTEWRRAGEDECCDACGSEVLWLHETSTAGRRLESVKLSVCHYCYEVTTALLPTTAMGHSSEHASMEAMFARFFNKLEERMLLGVYTDGTVSWFGER